MLSRHPERLQEYQILVLPGGFTYGDYVGAGSLFAADLRHVIGDEILRFLAEGKFILGICNGFQVLVKSGLLPSFEKPFEKPSVTLEANKSLKFEDRWVHLTPEGKSFWTRGLSKIITLPVAHAEGRFLARDKKLKVGCFFATVGGTVAHLNILRTPTDPRITLQRSPIPPARLWA